MKRVTFMMMIVVAFMLASCGGSQQPTNNQQADEKPENTIESIKNGMNKAEVIKIVGDPDKVMPIFGDVEWWYYGDNSIVVIGADTVANVVLDVKETGKQIKNMLDSASKSWEGEPKK